MTIAKPVEQGRLMRIHVTEAGKPDVDVRIPLGLARFGMKVAAKTASEQLEKSGVDLDQLLREIDTVGKIVDIADADTHVEIFVE